MIAGGALPVGVVALECASLLCWGDCRRANLPLRAVRGLGGMEPSNWDGRPRDEGDGAADPVALAADGASDRPTPRNSSHDERPDESGSSLPSDSPWLAFDRSGGGSRDEEEKSEERSSIVRFVAPVLPRVRGSRLGPPPRRRPFAADDEGFRTV
jgi:hypothetical protein